MKPPLFFRTISFHSSSLPLVFLHAIPFPYFSHSWYIYFTPSLFLFLLVSFFSPIHPTLCLASPLLLPCFLGPPMLGVRPLHHHLSCYFRAPLSVYGVEEDGGMCVMTCERPAGFGREGAKCRLGIISPVFSGLPRKVLGACFDGYPGNTSLSFFS